MRKELEDNLVKMINMINEANEMCNALGRHRYNYVPEIQTQVLQNGMKKPIVVCKAYPDADSEFHNELSMEVFEDKLYMIKDKWEKHQYALDSGK